MLNWGCEFLEDGDFGAHYQSEPRHSIYLPIDLLLKIADPRLIQEARLRTEKISELTSDIQARGLLVPGTCYMDARTIRYQDGYHRLTACLNLGYLEFPIEIIQVSSKINARGLALNDLVERLFDKLYLAR